MEETTEASSPFFTACWLAEGGWVELQLAQALEKAVEPTQNAPQRCRQHDATRRDATPWEDEDDQVQEK